MLNRQKIWSLIVVLLIYWISVGYCINIATERTGGKLTYIYDDAYIHMAIAKNVVQSGVWGVTPHEFTSTTSSPLWTVLLSGIFGMIGTHEFVPLWMNLAAGTGLLLAVYWILARHQLPALYIFLALLAIWLLLPLPFLTLAGMEHILHALLTILYVYFSAQILTGISEKQPSGNIFYSGLSTQHSALFFLTPLLVMTRYEGLFLIFTVCGLFVLRRNLKMALLLGILAAAPLLIYGLINVHNDWFWLPGSVLIKSERPRGLHSLKDAIWLAAYYPRHGYITIARNSLFTMLMVFAVAGSYLAYRREKWSASALMLVMVSAMIFFHMMFAAPFIRYYPYLIAAAIVPVTLVIYSYQRSEEGDLLPSASPRSRGENLRPPLFTGEGWGRGLIWEKWGLAGGLILLLIVATSPFSDRGYDLLERIPGAMTNINDQQYQMGLFVQQYYNDDRVAMNDIGTTSYLTDVHLLDLVGLGTLDVAKIIVDKAPFGASEIDAAAQAHGARIAIVYDAWYQIPPTWIPVGYWSTPSAGFLGSDTVTFYAIDPAAEAELITNLQDFSSQLPDRVAQAGKYVDTTATR